MLKKNAVPDVAGSAAPQAPSPTAAASNGSDADAAQALQAALGDDVALLALARGVAPLETRLAAVGAITGEATLKLAERDMRDHDRRLHRLAKQRHLAVQAQREAREEATRLIDAATALQQESPIPTNRLVDIDRAWQALDASLLEPEQCSVYAGLLEHLKSLTRERGDQTLRIERWQAEASLGLDRLQAACLACASGTQPRLQLAQASSAAASSLADAPEPAAPLSGALQRALDLAARLDMQLVLLDAVLTAPTVQHAETPEAASGESPPTREATDADAVSRWQQRETLSDVPLDALLNQRFVLWQQAQEQAHEAQRASRREQSKDRQRAQHKERIGALSEVIALGEAALAAGHLAEAHKQLVAIDALVHDGPPAAALAARIERLQAEYAQLKGWQHWAGGRARDELVLQAEALAAATRGDTALPKIKLSTRQQAEVIDDMRARWKELDRLGGATSRALWQRFDSALKAAYEPVAAQVAVQRAARVQNLQARRALIEALDTIGLPGTEESPQQAPGTKALASALDHFQTEWRKLGPLEHTVPRNDHDTLVARMKAAVTRLETPLQEARRGAREARERLIAHAVALGAQASAGAHPRDSVNQLRDLQAEWQHQARTQPLARAAENALWSEFRSACDAVFSARNAVIDAREAEFQAHGAERSGLIERLESLPANAPPAELERALTSVDSQWRRAGPAPRKDAAALDARYRRASETLRERLAAAARGQWQGQCDTLRSKLALCEELESSDATQRDALLERWAALGTLPAAWDNALAHRAALPGPGRDKPPAVATSTDDLLLRLEMDLAIASPADFEAARRNLKLKALKAALEGRPAADAAPSSTGACLAELVLRPRLAAPQRERLAGVITALRERPPLAGS